MKAKDTVMTLDVVKEFIPLETVEIVGQKLGYEGHRLWEAFRNSLERQAEISFKAGMAECAKSHFKPGWMFKAHEVKEATEEGYKAGYKQALKDHNLDVTTSVVIE